MTNSKVRQEKDRPQARLCPALTETSPLPSACQRAIEIMSPYEHKLQPQLKLSCKYLGLLLRQIKGIKISLKDLAGAEEVKY